MKIISLLTFISLIGPTVVEAAPRYRPNKSTCQRILVDDHVANRVSAIGLELAEFLYDANELKLTETIKQIQYLQGLLQETRAAFTISQEMVTQKTRQLNREFTESRGPIVAAIQQARFPRDPQTPNPNVSEAPVGFEMDGLGRAMFGWPPNSNDRP